MRANWKKQSNRLNQELAGNLVLADLEALGEETRNLNADNEFLSATSLYLGRVHGAKPSGTLRERHYSALGPAQFERCSERAVAEGAEFTLLLATFSISEKHINYWLVPAALISPLISSLKTTVRKKGEASKIHIIRRGERDLLDLPGSSGEKWELDVTRYHRRLKWRI